MWVKPLVLFSSLDYPLGTLWVGVIRPRAFNYLFVICVLWWYTGMCDSFSFTGIFSRGFIWIIFFHSHFCFSVFYVCFYVINEIYIIPIKKNHELAWFKKYLHMYMALWHHLYVLYMCLLSFQKLKWKFEFFSRIRLSQGWQEMLVLFLSLDYFGGHLVSVIRPRPFCHFVLW